jgi:uncharacterized protein
VSALERLLAVQEHDTTIDQLEHRRAHLPERSELAAVQARVAEVEAQLAETRAARDAVSARQERFEQETAHVEARIKDIETRMYSGAVSASRELQAMSAEVESSKERRSTLEDNVLAAMEEAEPIDEAIAGLVQRRADHDAEAEQLHARIAEAEVAIDAELEKEREARADVVADVPEELVSTYERLRAKLGGVGAARLVGSSCTGCHLTLPAGEVARIKRLPTDALVFCDQCERILVHS